MGQIKIKEEVKKDERVLYSECYDVKFWKQDKDTLFWRQESITYYGVNKGEHESVFKRWSCDHAGMDVKFISVSYI